MMQCPDRAGTGVPAGDAPVRPVEVLLGDWASLGARAGAIRQEVFVVEQGIDAALEWDGIDPQCLHALALDARGQAVGTGRLLPDGHIGRMAVRAAARGQGVGAALLARLVQAAQARGDRLVQLSAQRTAEAFYRRHGFEPVGQPYEEAGIAHVRMRRALCEDRAGVESA